MRNDLIELTSLDDPAYKPGRLLNAAAYQMHAENDQQLAALLEIDKAIISRVRRRKMTATANLLVRIMDRTGWSIQHARELLGAPYDGCVYPTLPSRKP